MKTEEILLALSKKCTSTVITGDEIGQQITNGTFDYSKRFVPYSVIENFINSVGEEERLRLPIQQFLFVEDGSVDSDNLIETLEMKNPEIKVVIYRQGAVRPQLVDRANNANK